MRNLYQKQSKTQGQTKNSSPTSARKQQPLQGSQVKPDLKSSKVHLCKRYAGNCHHEYYV